MYLAFALVGVDRIAGALLNVDVVAVRPTQSWQMMAHNTVKNWGNRGEAKTLGNWERKGTLVNSKTEISTGRLAKKEYTGTLNFKAKQH